MLPAVSAALISGAANLIKTAYGHYGMGTASDAARQAVKYQEDKDGIIDGEEGALRDWYNRNYYEDATQRADAQELLRYTADQVRRRNKAAAGAQAVMGGTEESLAAEKAANGRAMADVAGRIAAAGASRKDSVDAAYLEGMRGVAGQRLAQRDALSDIEMQRAANVSKAARELGSLDIDAASIAKALAGGEG